MDPKRYDLVVIGSGPAGEKGAAQAAYFGKRVAIVEAMEHLGGAAANTGTLPSKTLRETSLLLAGFRSRELYGVDLSLRREATVEDFLHRERNVKEQERHRARENVSRHGIDLYTGHGSFVDPHVVRVEHAGDPPVELHGDTILIATGSSPRRPDRYPFDHPKVYDSDTVLQLDEMPESLIVVGGGVIGCEYACTFGAFEGIEVDLIDGSDVLLGFLDREISLSLMDRMRKLGIRIHGEERVESCDAETEGVRVGLTSGKEIRARALLVAAGRISNVQSLNLEAAGLTPGHRGVLEVDEHYRTKVPHIFAAGDVIGHPALASTSMEQARYAMVQAFELEYKKDVAPILPYGVYTIPEVSCAGKSEEELQESGVDYVVGRASYGENPRGTIIGDHDGFLKLIFRRRDMKLLGVHVIGEIASELVHVGLTALMVGATSDLFIRTCFNYPTLGDLYKYATYDAMGKRRQEG